MISIVYFSPTGERKSKFASVAGPALLRHIALSASSFKRPGLPMAPPLGELSSECETERLPLAFPLPSERKYTMLIIHSILK